MLSHLCEFYPPGGGSRWQLRKRLRARHGEWAASSLLSSVGILSCPHLVRDLPLTCLLCVTTRADRFYCYWYRSLLLPELFGFLPVSNIHGSMLIQKETWISILYRHGYSGQKKENLERYNITPLPSTKTIPDELKIYLGGYRVRKLFMRITRKIETIKENIWMVWVILKVKISACLD